MQDCSEGRRLTESNYIPVERAPGRALDDKRAHENSCESAETSCVKGNTFMRRGKKVVGSYELRRL